MILTEYEFCINDKDYKNHKNLLLSLKDCQIFHHSKINKKHWMCVYITYESLKLYENWKARQIKIRKILKKLK